MINHTKAVVVLDLETTGIWIEKDKIVEIAMIKALPDGSRENFLKRINPGIPIPPYVSQIIGIKDEDVAGCPFFRQIAKEALDFLGDSDFAGFNVERFDLPLLEREFREAGLVFDWQRRDVYDAQKVFHVNEKRDLTTAYKFYCNKNHENAHSAMADAEATLEILKAQVAKYAGPEHGLAALSAFDYRENTEYFGETKKFRWWNKELYPLFGKYAKKLSLQEIARRDPDYLKWILSADFSDEVKELVQEALKNQFPVYGQEKKSKTPEVPS